MPPRQERSAWLIPAAVFLACWALYLPTLNPAFRADDSPETMAAAVTLGIQHPPAYPLHTLLGRLASFLPLGAPCWRLNLMAAFFGALACALLAALGQRLGRRYGRERGLEPAQAAQAGALTGVVAGLAWGASGTFWSQSLAAKGGIYTLHQALVTGSLLLLVRWAESLEERPVAGWAEALSRAPLQGAALLAALGLANHWETQALILPSAGLFMGLALWPVRRAPRRGLGLPLARLGLLVVAGLAVYLILPLRARLSPFLNWGDPRDWKQFCWVLMRQEYLDLETGFLKSLRAALFAGGGWSAVGENWQVVQRQGLRVLSHACGSAADLGLPLVLLGLPGLWVLRPGWRPWKAGLLPRLGAALLVLVLSFVGVVTFYFHLKEEMVWILDVFLLPMYMVQALLAGLGALWLLLRLQPAWRRRLLPWAAGAALLALPGSFYAARAPRLSQARQFLAWDFAQDLLLSVRQNGILLAEGDFNTMPVYYLQQVLGQRPDVDHVTTVFLSTDWGVEQARRVQPRLGIGAVPKAITGDRAGDGQVLRAALGQIAAANLPRRPLYASQFRQVLSANVPEWEPEHAQPDGWSWRPEGLLVELEPVRQVDSPAQERRRLGLLNAYRSRHLELDRATLDPSPAFALSNYGTAFLETALYLRAHHRAAEAMPLYRKAVQWTSRPNLAETWTHYGIALGSGGDGLKPDLAGAAACFQEALAVHPIFEAYANLAGVDNQLGQTTKQARYYAQAEAASRQALSLSPANPQAWNNLGISLYYQGRAADARQALARAAQLAPTDPQIVGNLRALGAH
jgi:tetratricopeptide (TPR) repeat protein